MVLYHTLFNLRACRRVSIYCCTIQTAWKRFKKILVLKNSSRLPPQPFKDGELADKKIEKNQQNKKEETKHQ